MRVLDSNILIYAHQEDYEFLLPWVFAQEACVSAISITEVLGFPGLAPVDEVAFREWFENLHVLGVTLPILHRAAALRRQRRMKLGDAIIAATALEHRCQLVTRNETDFRGIHGLELINPFPA